MGFLIAVGEHRMSVEEFEAAFRARTRPRLGIRKVKPDGLHFITGAYPDQFSLGQYHQQLIHEFSDESLSGFGESAGSHGYDVSPERMRTDLESVRPLIEGARRPVIVTTAPAAARAAGCATRPRQHRCSRRCRP